MQNIISHLKTEKYRSKMKQQKHSEETRNKLIQGLHQKRASNKDAAGCSKMDKYMKIRLEFKRAQMKSFSSRKTLEIYTDVAGRHLEEGNLSSISHWMDYTPIIHQYELGCIKKNFEGLSRPTILIEDGTTLVDEQV